MIDVVELKYQIKRLFRIGLFALKTIAILLIAFLIFQVFMAYRRADQARERYRQLQSQQEQLINDMENLEIDSKKINQDFKKLPTKLDEQKPQVSPTTSSEKHYTVKAGDSSWKIAKELYGRGEYYLLLEKANGLKHNQWLEVGQELVIPQLDEAESTASEIETKPTGQVQDYQPNNTTHLVVKGECLWTIAAKEANNPFFWTKIYTLNKETIGNNPNLIYPGMVLRL